MPDPIDAAVVAELKHLMGDELDALLAAFQDDATARLAVLRWACEQRDAARVREQAHSLKGAAANIGARDLAACCERLEAAARQGRCAQLGSAVEAVQAALDVCLAALARFPYRDD